MPCCVLRRRGLPWAPLLAGSILRRVETQRHALLPNHYARSVGSQEPLEFKPMLYFSFADFSSKPYRSGTHLGVIDEEEINKCGDDDLVEEKPELYPVDLHAKNSANTINLTRSYHSANVDVLDSRRSLVHKKDHGSNSRIECHDVEGDNERLSPPGMLLTANHNKQKARSLGFCYGERNESARKLLSYEGPGFREEEIVGCHHKHKQRMGWQGENFHLFKSRGQHLLTNPQVLDSIIQKAKILPTDTVLEIGPGTGNLTVRLLEHAKKVIAIEIDERMVDTLLKRTAKLGFEDKLSVIKGNALKMELPQFDLCVSNIPYGISSPLLAKLFLMPHKSYFRSAILLLQKEFACRLLAKPGESDFNRLAVNVGLVASVDFLMNVSKRYFVPCPKVDSSLVQIKPKLNIPNINLDEWLGFTRTCFSTKNKTLYAIFKQKKKVIELYEKSQSSNINCRISQYEDQAIDNESDSGDELEEQNSVKNFQFKDKIIRILKDGGFGEKRPSKLSNEDFLCLLQLFNKEGVFFR